MLLAWLVWAVLPLAPARADVVEELEALNARTNDTVDRAQPIALGDAVLGTVGVVVGTSFDVDAYVLDVGAGAVLQITLTSTQADLQPFFRVEDGRGSYERLASAPAPLSAVTRQLYIPRPRSYFSLITDVRNRGPSPALVGGARFTYELRVERRLPPISPVLAPGLDHRTP
ncbi:MAG: hypothetical protein ACE5FG_15190 [Myxococcota bacterium]